MLVKDNQPLLHRKLQCLFAGSTLFELNLRQAQSSGLAHGRQETRSLAANDLPAGYVDFADATQAFCLRRRVTLQKSGVVREETVYGITSLSVKQASAKRLLSLVRGHWQIENKSHWVRDVTFDEDRSQVRSGSIPQVLAAVRNTCIGLMRLSGHANMAAACRRYAAQPDAALTLLGIK